MKVLSLWLTAACLFLTAQTPLSMEQAVAEALDRNLGLLAERYNISIADARIITARLRPNLVLSIGGDHLDLLGTGYNAVNAAGPSEYSVRTDFVFERGRKRENRVAVAVTSKSVVELQLVNTLRGVVLEVQNAFVEVLLAKSNLVLATENLEAFRSIVRLNETRVKAGDLAEIELLRVQLAELQFENAVRQAELRAASARTRLRLLLGRTGQAGTFDVVGELRRDEVLLSLDTLREQARLRRPDVKALANDQARSLAELRLQIAQGAVDYTVGTEYRRQQGLAGRGNSLGVFFQTTIPVFNRNQGEIERTRQEQRQIEARMRALTAAVENEVDLAYMQFLTSQATLQKVETTMLPRAREVRQISQYSYTRGEATLIEFLDGQRAYNETVQIYNDARAEYARSLYQMDAATGSAASR
ncbi:MAG TPA: TolC family protein [Bryobacteraceae bacterium]|nr:TolC family protein [Bryobacteraceae bacterium]